MARKYASKSFGKKAYLKTLEAVIAIVLSFIFLIFLIPSKPDTQERRPDLDLINVLGQNPTFRTCVLIENYSCTNTTFEAYYPQVIIDYNYRFNISSDPKISGIELPAANIHSESLVIAGNDTYINPKTVRLYYWLK